MQNIFKILLFILFILFFQLYAVPYTLFPVSAVDCPSGGVVRGTNPAGLHRYTSRECNPTRASGSIIGPDQFGRPENYRCLGACKYEVNYCTSDGCEAVYPQDDCPTSPPQCNNSNTGTVSPIGDVFGKIVPPKPIIDLGFGASGIGKFLSNLIRLIYSLAGIALIFMIIWGAWDWITSEGNKEKLDSARNKIMNAIIGILIFASAFAIIFVLGKFTGFTFFK